MSFSILLAIVLSATDPNAADTIKVFDAAGDARTFAAAAHLPPLDEKQPEVRVWSQTALLGTLTGWVISSSEIQVYSNSESVDGVLKVDKDRMRREKTVRSKTIASELLFRFSQFANLDGKAIVCPVHDGSSLVIDGMAGGHHFSVYSGNPSFCETPGAKEIADAFSRLAKSAKVRSNYWLKRTAANRHGANSNQFAAAAA